ncbi:TetR family transcriptional regulator [Microbacterium sp. P05]|uniref:TetR family transcriptional regulator n=1 Tax=Microbacterium sp. P05 TaxID=3366948 RepID=UPI0037468BAA
MLQPDIAKRANGLATQRKLLAAAGAIFAQTVCRGAAKNIAVEADISQGSLYFHFGHKDEIAKAVIAAQQKRVDEVLARVRAWEETALEQLFLLMERLADLIASDELVQAGIRLATQQDAERSFDVGGPYAAWERVMAATLRDGIADGSMAPDMDHRSAAELINEIFVGAENIAGITDKWASLPHRIATTRATVRLLLTTSLPQ